MSRSEDSRTRRARPGCTRRSASPRSSVGIKRRQMRRRGAQNPGHRCPPACRCSTPSWSTSSCWNRRRTGRRPEGRCSWFRCIRGQPRQRSATSRLRTSPARKDPECNSSARRFRSSWGACRCRPRHHRWTPRSSPRCSRARPPCRTSMHRFRRWRCRWGPESNSCRDRHRGNWGQHPCSRLGRTDWHCCLRMQPQRETPRSRRRRADGIASTCAAPQQALRLRVQPRSREDRAPVRARLGQRRVGVSGNSPSPINFARKSHRRVGPSIAVGVSMHAGKTAIERLASRAHDFTVGICAVALIAVGCGGSSSSPEAVCSLDPTCYVSSANGTCEVDPKATCTDGVWSCGPGGVLGSGCTPDGGDRSVSPKPVPRTRAQATRVVTGTVVRCPGRLRKPQVWRPVHARRSIASLPATRATSHAPLSRTGRRSGSAAGADLRRGMARGHLRHTAAQGHSCDFRGLRPAPSVHTGRAMRTADRMFRVIVAGGIALSTTAPGLVVGCGGSASTLGDGGFPTEGPAHGPDAFPAEGPAYVSPTPSRRDGARGEWFRRKALRNSMPAAATRTPSRRRARTWKQVSRKRVRTAMEPPMRASLRGDGLPVSDVTSLESTGGGARRYACVG